MIQTPAGVRGIGAALVIGAIWLAGCRVDRVPADRAREISASPVPLKVVPDDAWPKCATEKLESDEVFRMLESTVVFDTIGIERVAPLMAIEQIVGTRVLVRDAVTPAGNGVIAWQTYCTQAGCMRVEPMGFGALPLVFSSWRAEEGPREPPHLSLATDRLRSPPRIEPRFGATMTMSFVYRPAIDPAKCRGLIVFLPPITGVEFVEPVLKQLHDRNWAILQKEYGTFRLLSGPIRPQERRPEGRIEPGEQLQLETGPAPTAGEAAACCARTLEGLAHVAYSVEAAVQFVYSEFPDDHLDAKPLVLLATSLGAVQGPTVACRLPRVDAAVFVGGGADILGILAANGVEGLSERIVDAQGRRRPVSRELADELQSEYLRTAVLDPYNTAPCLANRPVLMLHAAADGRVPAQYGELLWERLGKPERWVANYGHDLLFYFLGDHAVEIADWIDTHVPDDPAKGEFRSRVQR